jgi:uncharacterized repeat protein (TIGR02543 family)
MHLKVGPFKSVSLLLLLLFSALVCLIVIPGCTSSNDDSYYLITYEANGATSGTVPGSAYLKSYEKLTLPDSGSLRKTNSSFGGWLVTTSYYSSGTLYSIGSQVSGSLFSNNTARPYWCFKITYQANGATAGNAPVDANKYYSGAYVESNSGSNIAGVKIQIKDQGTLVKTGSTFAGWNTKADGTGIDLNAGNSWQPARESDWLASTHILYAKWVTGYSVTYDGNGNTGGTVPTDTKIYNTNTQVTVAANTGSLVKTGNAFTGWNTQANGQGTHYAASGAATFSMASANVTLYAEWAPTYNVTYNGNGNSGGAAPADNSAYIQGASVTVQDAGSLVNTGFTFAGWNTAADGSGTSYAANASFSMPANNVTLYAKWNANVSAFTVTYDGNGNDVGTAPADATHYNANATVTVLGAGTLARTGFTFGGWSTVFSPVGPPMGGDTYQQGDHFQINANVTLYAIWTAGGASVFHMIYNGNGNDGGTAPVDNNNYQTGATVNVYGNQMGQLTKTGFTFNGWNTKADGTGTHYAGDGTDNLTMGSADITLYAEWQ